MKRIVFLFAYLAGAALHAQDVNPPHAARFGGFRGLLQFGVGASYLKPDYGQGVAVGINPYVALDFKRSHFGVELDGTYATANRSTASPDSLIFSGRGGLDLNGRLHPYVRPGIGYGHFSGVSTVNPGKGQNYFVVDFGYGMDVLVTGHLGARIYGDYQYWPGFNGDTTNALDHGGPLTPISAGIGIAYRY